MTEAKTAAESSRDGRARVLILILRAIGVSSLFGLVAVFMPLSWMCTIHRWLGLGEMPTMPVVEYLARSLSAFYALLGAIFLLVSFDLERYRRMVRFLALAAAILSAVLTGIDLAAGMPWWWSVFEGPPGVLVGAWLFYLAQPGRSQAPPAA